MKSIFLVAAFCIFFACKKSEPSVQSCVCTNVQGVVVSSQTFEDSASQQCTQLSNYSQTCRLE
jgi:hypothetical protein